MRYPKFINKGDKITLIAPSFGATTEPYNKRVKRAINKFEKLGYKIEVGENVYKADLPYLSSTPQLIAKEFMENYLASDSKMLLSVGGGELQCESLPYIDFDLLRNAEPKWFNGFSDNTNYTFLVTTLLDTASIYGHCAGAFGMYNWHQSIMDDYLLFSGEKLTVKGYPNFQIRSTKYQKEHPLSGYHLTEKKVITPIGDNCSKFSGRLLGGCLDILIMLCGTKYDKVKEFIYKYYEDGIIWFLEACDLSPVALKRALFQLKEAGWFENCKGFLIGRGANSYNKEDFGINHLNALDIIKDLNVPILADIDLGHLAPTMPLICGAYANVSFKDELIIEMLLK